MTHTFKNLRHLSLTLAAFSSVAAYSTVAQAQQVLVYNSYAGQISIDVPTAAATATCTPLAPAVPTEKMVIKRTFFDMFDTFDLNTNKWTPHLDGGYDAATKTWLGYTWLVKRYQPAANEQQLYVDPAYKGTGYQPLGLNPFILEGGLLHIVAQPTPDGLKKVLSNFAYTSGIITTRKSHLQRYGYFEARIKVPSTQGLLPAFWLLPFNKAWPPELDVMEAPTQEKDSLSHNVHWLNASGKATSSSCRTKYPNYSDDFHQYGALWTPTKIVYYIDRVPVAQILTPPGMNVHMYMQLNLAVGADWVGKVNALQAKFPAEMIVDNVVAYSQEGPTSCALQDNGVLQCPAK